MNIGKSENHEENKLLFLLQEKQDQIDIYKQENENLKKKVEQYYQAYDRLQYQIKELIRNRFGQKTERYIDPENPQLDLFADYKFQEARVKKGEKETIEVKPHKRSRKKKNTELDLPRRVEIIPANEEDYRCSCGATKEVIRYKTKELLHHIPEVFEIIEQKREVLACKHGCENSIKTASAPLHVLPKARVTESFLAFLIVSKIQDRQPLYHLEKKLLNRYKIDCSRTVMANWLIKLIKPLQPLYNLMKDEIIKYDVASCDATTLQVLKEPGRSSTVKSYVYCMRGGTPDKKVVLYDYNDREHKKYLLDWFTDFKGYLHIDADPFFDDLISLPEVHASNCNVHARRKFEPIAKQAKKKGLAKEAMRFYKNLYKIERKAKELKPKDRHLLRLQEAKPIMDEFKTWLDKNHPLVLPLSPLGKAFNYCLKHWGGLTRFFEDGRLELDNNLIEQQIKPFVIARKNFLFSDTPEGAKALCIHFSMIQTARAYGINTYKYYEHILKKLPLCKTVEDFEVLLPWNYVKDPPS